MFTSADIGKVASFSVYAPGILQDNYTRVKIKAIIGWELARNFIDPATLHAAVYPTAVIGNPGMPNNYKAYNYVNIEFPDGQQTALGLLWINDGSIAVHENTSARFTVSSITVDDVEKIRQHLIRNGYNNIGIELL